MIVQSNDIEKSMKSFKQYRAKSLLELLKKENAKTILEQLQFYKKPIIKQQTIRYGKKAIALNYTNRCYDHI
jgi:hypothetical protein